MKWWKALELEVSRELATTNHLASAFAERLSFRRPELTREPTAEELIAAFHAGVKARLPRRRVRAKPGAKLTAVERKVLVTAMLGERPTINRNTYKSHAKRILKKLGRRGDTLTSLALRIVLSHVPAKQRLGWVTSAIAVFEDARTAE